jgi:hypothetical protein
LAGKESAQGCDEKVGQPVYDRPLTTHTGGVIAGWGFSLLLLVVLGFLFFNFLNNKNEELEEENG